MTVSETAASPDLVEVRVLGVPLPLLEQARQHQESLEREFRLIAFAAPDDAGHVTARLLALVEELADRFGTFGPVQGAIDAALARGDATIDLVYEVPETVREASLRLGALLDEADAFCRGGELLNLATPGACVDLRRWFLGEFVAQIGGAAPTPWGRWRP